MSNNVSLALVSCVFGGYKLASVLRCIGLVYLYFVYYNTTGLFHFTYVKNSCHSIYYNNYARISEFLNNINEG